MGRQPGERLFRRHSRHELARPIPTPCATIARDTIYTNVALLDDGDVWWEGKDGPVPAECTDWQGERWTPELGTKAAHPNSRFTVAHAQQSRAGSRGGRPARACRSARSSSAAGAADTVPLVYQSFDWTHGVFIGATMASETTAAAAGAVGQVRRDPMAMLPFCGYHMGDYFEHWLEMGARLRRPPLVFGVNWFRRDAEGKFLWPGFGENMRVLQWIIGRCAGRIGAGETAIGHVPRWEDLDLAGLPGFDPARFEHLMAVDPEQWGREAEAQRELFARIGQRLPAVLEAERLKLLARLEHRAHVRAGFSAKPAPFLDPAAP